MQENYKFKRHQLVYHITPESISGIVIERRTYDDNTREYLIAYGFGQSAWAFEEELSETKTFER